MSTPYPSSTFSPSPLDPSGSPDQAGYSPWTSPAQAHQPQRSGYASTSASPRTQHVHQTPSATVAYPISSAPLRASMSSEGVVAGSPIPRFTSPFQPTAFDDRFLRSNLSEMNRAAATPPPLEQYRGARSQGLAEPYSMPSGPHRGSLPTPVASPAPALGPTVYQMRRTSASSQASHGSSESSGGPSLSLPLPTMGVLARRRDSAIASGEERRKLQWAKNIVKYVEHEHGSASKVADPLLLQWIDEAMAVINRRAAASPPDVEAICLRGDLKASGNFPAYHAKDPRDAFNDYEKSGRGGYGPSWYRIGRDYEVHNSFPLSTNAYEKGHQLKDVASIYRLGRAYFFGQLQMRQDFERAMPLLKFAAELANEDVPEPPFFYGQIFAGEFAHLNIPEDLLRLAFDPVVNPHSSRNADQVALRFIERAAYLNHPAAQLKLGWAHEYASLECPFDPLLSVQYYSLASRNGKVEADMALSRWFLCGAEGCFEKNEALAFTFADKAARRSLPAAEFALAYYFEVGVGCEKNLTLAMQWYKRSAAEGNADAQERLSALRDSHDSAIPRAQYEAELDSRRSRTHAAARSRSIREGRGARGRPIDALAASVNVEAGLQGMSLNDEAPLAAPFPPGSVSQDLSSKKTLRMAKEVALTNPRRQLPPPGSSTPTRSRVESSSSEQGSVHPAVSGPTFGPNLQALGPRITRSPSPSGRGSEMSRFNDFSAAAGGGRGYATPPPPPHSFPQPQPQPQRSRDLSVPPYAPSYSPDQQYRNRDNVNGRRGAGAEGDPRDRRTSSTTTSGRSSLGTNGGGGGGGGGGTSGDPPGRRYSTFAEMGLQSAAMDKDRDCRIM